jgi:hypothetical protein
MKYSSLLLLLASTSTWSEISSLSASELTDTYIKDTTVIVRPEQPTQDVNEKVRVKLKVSPLEETASTVPNESEAKLSAISEDLNSYTELNEQAALSTNLQPTLPAVTTRFITPQPSEEALTLIRNAYHIDSDTAIDLTSQSLLSNLKPNLGLPNTGDAQYNTTSDSFTISIPNTGNFNSQNITSPNGEIGINVTPSRIEYTLNLPK